MIKKIKESIESGMWSSVYVISIAAMMGVMWTYCIGAVVMEGNAKITPQGVN